MSWYYSKNGMQLGPVSEEELRAKSKSGEVTATDLIWKEGMGDWKPLGQVSEFMGSVPAVPMGSVPMHQPAPMNPNQMPGAIPNYLWQSIVVTLFCCMPFGVVSIVYAAKVDGLAARGDIAGANAASKSAKTWVTAAAITGLVVIVLYILLVVSVGVSSGFN